MQKLDEQLDQLGNSLKNDSLSDEAKRQLLPLVVEVARCYVEEDEQQKLQKGLKWARVALSLGSNNGTTDGATIALLEAKLLEATAIDKLDQKHATTNIEQPLALAIERLNEVVTELDKLEAPSDLEKSLKAKAASLLQKNVAIYNLANYSLRRRYESKLRTLVKDSLNERKGSPLKGKNPMDVVKNKKVNSDLRVMSNISHKGLNLDAEYNYKPIPEALSAWQGLPEGTEDERKAKKKGEKKAKQMEKFMLLVDTNPPTYSLDLLKQHDAFRRNDVESLSIASWNAQLMNTIDGPTGACIEKAIKWKAKNIGKVVDEHDASLLVIQEAPGPQLRKRGGKIAQDIAQNNRFTDALKQKLPKHFRFAQVALENMKNGLEMGEDHIYCWDPQVMDIKERTRPVPLEPPKNQKWVGRAPSYATFTVNTWAAPKLLVVSVHAKSMDSDNATKRDVKMIGEAVLALQAKLEANNAAVDSVVIVGDFNIPPDQAAAALSLEGFTPAFGDTSIPTNIWRFNGTGMEKEGHAYDHGFFSSRAELSDFTATLASASEQDVEKTHGDMKKVAVAVLESLADANLETAAAKRAVDMIKDLTGVDDGVPSWLRQKFQKEVRLRWSDHLPIVLT